MRLLVVLPRVPFPLDKGDKLRAYHQLKELASHFQLKIVALDDSSVIDKYMDHLREEFNIEVIKLKKATIVYRLFRALFSDKPFQVHYFFQRQANRRILELINDFQPDHIYCQLIRTAEYVKKLHTVPKTIDYMDAFSKGMERRINGASFIKKYFIRLEASRLLKYENLIFDYFENKTIISDQDQSLIYHPERKDITVVQNGVDFDYFSPKSAEKKYDLVFTGNMSYPPNVDGAMYLVNEILPLVRAVIPNAKLLIAGASPTNQVIDLGCENVIVSGWVDDIRDAYGSASLFIAPMRIGTGLQNKLLEAMAMSLPCVTTDFANRALGAENGVSVLLGNTKEELAKAVIELLTNKQLADRVAKNGCEFIQNNYNWKTSTQRLIDLIKQ